MKLSRSVVIAASLVCVLCLSLTLVFAMDAPDNRASAAGLRQVGLIVIGPGADAERDGLIAKQLYVDVELRLLKAGVKVVPDADLQKLPGRPILVLTINTMKRKALGSYVYDTSLELRQSVSLIRDPNSTCVAATWSAQGALGITSTSKLAPQIRKSVADMSDQFLTAALAAPK